MMEKLAFRAMMLMRPLWEDHGEVETAQIESDSTAEMCIQWGLLNPVTDKLEPERHLCHIYIPFPSDSEP